MTTLLSAREIWALSQALGKVTRHGVSQDEYDEYRERHRHEWQSIHLASEQELTDVIRGRAAMNE